MIIKVLAAEGNLNAASNVDTATVVRLFNGHTAALVITRKTSGGSTLGSLTVNTDGTVNGLIKIDMTTIDCEDLQGRSKASLERHLRSDDFFSVESHPIATLTFKSKGGIGAGNKLAFNGDLEIKGISHPISFESELKSVDPKVSALVDMTFDRSKYNVRFRSGTFFQKPPFIPRN